MERETIEELCLGIVLILAGLVSILIYYYRKRQFMSFQKIQGDLLLLEREGEGKSLLGAKKNPSFSKRYKIRVKFKYCVNGEIYISERAFLIKKYFIGNSKFLVWQTYMANWGRQKIDVLYHPKNPKLSVLSFGEFDLGPLGLIGVGIIFVVRSIMSG